MTEIDARGQQWERIKVKLDSGAVDWVFTPEAGSSFDIEPSFFSKHGINYTAANGTEIRNYGQKTLRGYSNEWCPFNVNVQIADVKSNLAAGMRIIEAENRVVLDSEGSYIENKITGDRIIIRHENGCFVFDMWVPVKSGYRPAGPKVASGPKKKTIKVQNKYHALEEEDDMDTGEVNDGCQAVFIRQEP